MCTRWFLLALLQIEVDPSDRDSLRFFWVEDITAENPEIKGYRLCHVLFGAGPIPFFTQWDFEASFKVNMRKKTHCLFKH